MKRTPLRRRTPLRKRNARRLRRLRAVQFGPQAALCRRLPCCACGHVPSDPHHLKARGFGGVKSDDSQCVPLCRVCHTAVHTRGADFWRAARLDPREVIERMRAMVLEAQQPDTMPVSPLLGPVCFER